MASVSLKDIRKQYGATPIVRGVSLEIGDGEFVVLVGPSGCGKSTILRMIAGLEDISAGELSIGGRRVNELPPRDRDVAMVFQSYALYPHMTVRENMAFGLSIRRLPKAEIAARVDEAARILELGPLLDRLPKHLSGGQRQRVAMGRAIVRQPAVFLFDEPLSNLDANLRAQMRVELKRLHERIGVTMVYVTHDQVEAMTLADRIVVLNWGYVQQVGPPLEVFDRPANRFVGGFIGTPPMNFVEVSVGPDGVLAAPGIVCRPEPVPTGLAGLDPPRAVLGVRPNDIVLSDGGLPATIEVIEPLGWEANLHLELGGTRLVMRAESAAVARYRPGDRIGVAFVPGRTHLFDGREGGRIG